MWSGLPCIYMRILWKEVFNPIHFKTLFVYPYRDISSIIKVGCRTIRPCSGLTSLTLPAGITSIGEYAFRGCSGLTSIYVYSEKVPKMGTDVFKGCDANKCTIMVRPFDVE